MEQNLTTIAWKDGKIAYDSRQCRGDTIMSDNVSKKHKYKNHLFFLTGSCHDFNEFMEAIVDGVHENIVYDCSGLMVDPDSAVYEVGSSDNTGSWRLDLKDIQAPCTALGSGYQYALAAMDLGCTAKEAVQQAAKRDLPTGGKIKEHVIR